MLLESSRLSQAQDVALMSRAGRVQEVCRTPSMIIESGVMRGHGQRLRARILVYSLGLYSSTGALDVNGLGYSCIGH